MADSEFVLINVTVQPGAANEGIELLEEGDYKVKLSKPPVGGQANKRLIELLSKYFKA